MLLSFIYIIDSLTPSLIHREGKSEPSHGFCQMNKFLPNILLSFSDTVIKYSSKSSLKGEKI